MCKVDFEESPTCSSYFHVILSFKHNRLIRWGGGGLQFDLQHNHLLPIPPPHPSSLQIRIGTLIERSTNPIINKRDV